MTSLMKSKANDLAGASAARGNRARLARHCFMQPMLLFARFGHMGSDNLTKLQISHALGERSARVACLIVEALKGTLDLLDEQPSAVIEGLVDYAKNMQPPRGGREDLQVAIIKYGEYALEQARARERRLLTGITGESPKE
jgi:hypothetical protein